MTTIQLTKQQVQEFIYGSLDGFDFKETVKDLEALYKDSCPAMTIAFHKESGKYFALDWDSYESHYGTGENEFPSTELYEVELQEKTVVVKTWVAIKETNKEKV